VEKRKVNGKKRVELRWRALPRRNGGTKWCCHPFLGWCVLTWEERKTPDELVRELYEVVKLKLYAYDKYADAYLRAPT
jgi:hypothetical protein